MNIFFTITGSTKQNFHAKLDRYMQREEEYHQLISIIDQIRFNHPKMGIRDIYHIIQPQFIGRDRFEKYFMELGYGVEKVVSYKRTTNSNGVIRFPNKIQGIELTGINQVWVSDITYFRIGDKFYYLTFIMDLYSRLITGASCSKTLLTEDTTIKALKEAIKMRKTSLNGLIIHSDGGGQYYSKAFRKLTSSNNMINSMGESVYENPHAERVNGIIKNNYLKPYEPKNFKELNQYLKRAVRLYNTEKPHSALNKLAPAKFEDKQINMVNKLNCNIFVQPTLKVVNSIQA